MSIGGDVIGAHFVEWCLQTAKIKFNFLRILSENFSHTNYIRRTHTHTQTNTIFSHSCCARPFYRCISNGIFFLESNWIFFPIGTECNLIAHQITIKCLTAYNVIVNTKCEWTKDERTRPRVSQNQRALNPCKRERMTIADDIVVPDFYVWISWCVFSSLLTSSSFLSSVRSLFHFSVCLNIENPFNFPFVWKQNQIVFDIFLNPNVFLELLRVRWRAAAVHIVSVIRALCSLAALTFSPIYKHQMTYTVCQQSMLLFFFLSFTSIPIKKMLNIENNQC